MLQQGRSTGETMAAERASPLARRTWAWDPGSDRRATRARCSSRLVQPLAQGAGRAGSRRAPAAGPLGGRSSQVRSIGLAEAFCQMWRTRSGSYSPRLRSREEAMSPAKSSLR